MSGAKAKCWAGWCCVYLETGDLAVWMHTKESAEECRRFEEVTNGPCGELYPVTVVPTPRWEAMVAFIENMRSIGRSLREGSMPPKVEHMHAYLLWALDRVDAQDGDEA